MKKIFLIALLVVGLTGVYGTAQAVPFIFDQTQLTKLWQIYESPTSTTNYDLQVFDVGVTTSGYVVGPGSSVLYAGFISTTTSNPNQPFAYMQIGSNDTGTSSVTGKSGPTVSTLGVDDLSSYDAFTMSFLNGDDDTWWFNIFVSTDNGANPDNYYETTFTELLPNGYTMQTLNLSTASNLGNVTSIGFGIGGNMGTGLGTDPSTGDQFEGVTVNPVPEPSSMLLLGMGLFGLGGAVRRKRLKA